MQISVCIIHARRPKPLLPRKLLKRIETSACQGADPSISISDARRDATILETKIYDEAQSIDQYDRMCEETLARAGPPVLQFPTAQDVEPIPTPSGIDFGRYKDAAYYREGLFSAIYKAATPRDVDYFPTSAGTISELVALKVTTPSMMEPPHDSRREARILALAASPHVIPLLETFREAGSHFVLVFPFVPHDMNRLLQGGCLSASQIKNALRGLFSALSFIHARGIIHRDIKPSNILLKSPDGPAYLADFGISWAPNIAGCEPADEKITDVGTTCYRPPELLFGNKGYGCSLDLWAAGCTVAEALMPASPTLFDSGELGSDLALIQSMFSKLGTPNLTVWPEAAKLPDWGKVQFFEYPTRSWSELLPANIDTERDLISRLIRYESGERLTAAEVLQHEYFAN